MENQTVMQITIYNDTVVVYNAKIKLETIQTPTSKRMIK